MEIKQNEENINLCLEYIDKDKQEDFKNVIKGFKFSHNKPTLKLHFSDDKEQRNVFKITITNLRTKERISFNFGDSINNTAQGKDILSLYDVLTCIKSDFQTDTRNFKDFCADYGYNEDSIKALKTFKLCEKQNEKLKKIFTEREVLTFPN